MLIVGSVVITTRPSMWCQLSDTTKYRLEMLGVNQATFAVNVPSALRIVWNLACTEAMGVDFMSEAVSPIEGEA
jgi:hypothetical protein